MGTHLYKKRYKLGLVIQPSLLRRLREEDHMFKTSLGNLMRSCLKYKEKGVGGCRLVIVCICL